MSDKVFFTIAACNFGALAITLGQSVKRHHPDAEMVVCLLDDVSRAVGDEIKNEGLAVIYPEDVPIPDFESLVFKYSITEASTCIKPLLIAYFLDQGANNVIYLDPDIWCLRPLNEIFQILKDRSIVLTPHVISAVSLDISMGKELLAHGAYNLGFIAVKNDDSARQMCAWWWSMLENNCLAVPELNLFVDQKWMDVAPCLFEGVFILRDPAYNVAGWNLFERSIIKDSEGWKILPGNTKIGFVHFSGLRFKDGNAIDSPFKAQSTGMGEERKLEHANVLFDLYLREIKRNRLAHYLAINYAYERYSNGDLVSLLERSLYHDMTVQNKMTARSPFLTDQESFWSQCRSGGVSALSKKTSLRAMIQQCEPNPDFYSNAPLVQGWLAVAFAGVFNSLTARLSKGKGKNLPGMGFLIKVIADGRYQYHPLKFVVKSIVKTLGAARALDFMNALRWYLNPLNQSFLMEMKDEQN